MHLSSPRPWITSRSLLLPSSTAATEASVMVAGAQATGHDAFAGEAFSAIQVPVAVRVVLQAVPVAALQAALVAALQIPVTVALPDQAAPVAVALAQVVPPLAAAVMESKFAGAVGLAMVATEFAVVGSHAGKYV
mmetsp:Transcript_87219/g.154498  ORF Transcript_87219/g.154498 Transcript_87219/m.154498 type:complete len:135 (-) Transcript_87219:184-588(-)